MSGISIALELTTEILRLAKSLNHQELQDSCRNTIITLNDRDSLTKMNSVKKVSEKEKTIFDFIPTIESSTPEQIQNRNLRFGNKQQTTNPQITINSNGIFPNTNFPDQRDYEDVISIDILKAPICDMCVVQRGDPIPQGYYRLSKTLSNKKANLNSNSGGNHLYVCIKKDLTRTLPAITSIVIVFPDKNEFIPPGFSVVKHGPYACNINAGTSCEKIYICYKKDKYCNPITDVLVLMPGMRNEETIPKNFNLIETSSTGIPANLNLGTTGNKILLCYRREMSRLSCLLIKNENQMGMSTLRCSKAPSSTNLSRMTKRRMSLSKLQAIKQLLSSNTIDGTTITGTGTSTHTSAENHLNNITTTNNTMNDGSNNTTRVTFQEHHPSLLSSSSSDEIPPMRSKPAIPSPVRSPDSSTHSRTSPTAGSSSSDRPANENHPAAAAYQSQRTDESSTTVGKDDYVFISPRADTSEQVSEQAEDEEHEEFLEEQEDEEGIEENSVKKNDMLEEEVEIDRSQQVVVDSTGQVIPYDTKILLYPLLASLYILQGNIAVKSLQGLCTLLKDTNFYEKDIGSNALLASYCVTMLEMTVECVCDRFDICIENETETYLSFIRILIKHSAGRISSTILQRLFRTLSFQCNYYSTRRYWFVNGHSIPYSNQGQELLSFRVLKELIWTIVARVEKSDIAHSLPESTKIDDLINSNDMNESTSISKSILLHLLEDVIDAVEVNRLCEMTQVTITKQINMTSTSNFFWKQISSLSRKSFTDSSYKTAFLALCALCRLAGHNIRTQEMSATPRDLGSKLFALETLLEFCTSAGEKMRLSKVMGYQIRRLVIPCLLINLPIGMYEHRLFAKLVRIISALWKYWRVHIRIELANLVKQFVIPVLQASTMQIRPVYQLIVIQEVQTWFDQPHLILEMFVNFDMDGKFVSHWNVFSHLVQAMCAIARRSALITGAWDWRRTTTQPTTTLENLTTQSSVNVREVNIQGVEAVAKIAKTLMDATGHAFLSINDPKFKMELSAHDRHHTTNNNNNSSSGGSISGGGDYDIHSVYSDTSSAPLTPHDNTNNELVHEYLVDSNVSSSRESLITITTTTTTPSPEDECSFSVRYRRAIHLEAEEHLKKAIKIYQDKNSLKKAIRYLIDHDFMVDSPQEIASFLRVYKNSFDPSAIGDFLGEGGLTPHEEVYWSSIRFRYTRAVTFVEMELVPALRLFLTGCGFRLPGEAQKIDRFVDVFQKTYWQDNAYTSYCPFKSPDTVHILTYAIIMLNTDLHRANIDDKRHKKKTKKMTQDQFINNLRGCDQGSDISKEYLIRIYENISTQVIELAVESSESSTNKETTTNGTNTITTTTTTNPTTTGGSNTTTNTTHNNASNMNPTNNSREINTQTVNSINTNNNNNTNNSSIRNLGTSSTSLASTQEANYPEINLIDEIQFNKTIAKNLLDSVGLLRSLSSFTYPFQLTSIDTHISLDLVSYMFESVWYHFHAITSALLSDISHDLYVTFPAMDILYYALTSAILLNVIEEKKLFANQLQQLQQRCRMNNKTINDVGNNRWYERLDDTSSDNILDLITELHSLFIILKDSIQQSTSYEITRKMAAKIEKRMNILDNNTFFVREGNLGKRNRNGRLDSYRFFLFSDNLYYCHHGIISGEYKVHEQLDLCNMSIGDVDEPTGCCIYIQHPTKSFIVVAENQTAKALWYKDINQTIDSCIKRQATISKSSRRLSMVDRIVTQKKDQKREAQKLRLFLSNTHQYIRSSFRHSLSGATSPKGSTTNKLEISDIDAALSGSGEGLDSSSSTTATSPSSPAGPVTHSISWNHQTQSSTTTTTTPAVESKTNAPPVLTTEEKMKLQIEAQTTFQQKLETLNQKSLNSLYIAGKDFWKGTMESRSRHIKEDIQVKMTVLQKIVKNGMTETTATTNNGNNSSATSSSSTITSSTVTTPHESTINHNSDLLPPPPPPTSPPTINRNDSSMILSSLNLSPELYEEVSNLSPNEAIKLFLINLYAIAPYWKYEQFL